MLEEHQVRGLRTPRPVRGLAQRREPAAQPGEQHQRPVRRARLDHEVAGEPAPGPGGAAGPGVPLGFRVTGLLGDRAPRGRRRRAGPAEHGPDHPALLTGPRRGLDVAGRGRETPPQHREQLAGLATGPPVHGGEQRLLGLVPVPAEDAGQSLIQVTAGRRLRERAVPRQRGEHTRLELRGVGNHQHPAGIGHHRAAQHPRDLQRAAAARRPPAGHHAAHHVLGAEPPVPHPGVQPGPAVRGVQPGQLLVLQQRRDRRVVDLAQHGEPGRRHPDPRAGQRAHELGGRVQVHRPPAERRRDLPGELGQPGRARPGQCGGRPRPEQSRQHVVV